jgi:quinol monooxygenase YgiN
MNDTSSYLLMVVTYTTKPGLRSAFHNVILREGLQEASRQEAGNIAYDYFLSIDRPDELLLVEKWIDKEALTLHKTLPHFLKLQALKDEFIENVKVIMTPIECA